MTIIYYRDCKWFKWSLKHYCLNQVFEFVIKLVLKQLLNKISRNNNLYSSFHFLINIAWDLLKGLANPNLEIRPSSESELVSLTAIPGVIKVVIVKCKLFLLLSKDNKSIIKSISEGQFQQIESWELRILFQLKILKIFSSCDYD